MKKVLILGITGMLGHRTYLKMLRAGFQVKGTIRGQKKNLGTLIQNDADIIENVDFSRDGYDYFEDAIAEFKPEVIINAIGVVKQKDMPESQFVQMNSYLPHKLYEISEKHLERFQFIQISTDCVFSGDEGGYDENHPTDAFDVYGLSKRLGELNGENALTIRTSIYGHELFGRRTGILEWFLGETGEVKGFTNAYFSGLTTNALAETMIVLIEKNVKGLLHVHSDRISKYDLLKKVKVIYGLEIALTPSEEPKLDRSLKSARSEVKVPNHETMILNMKEEHNAHSG